jgi:hypothetical protein
MLTERKKLLLIAMLNISEDNEVRVIIDHTIRGIFAECAVIFGNRVSNLAHHPVLPIKRIRDFLFAIASDLPYDTFDDIFEGRAVPPMYNFTNIINAANNSTGDRNEIIITVSRKVIIFECLCRFWKNNNPRLAIRDFIDKISLIASCDKRDFQVLSLFVLAIIGRVSKPLIENDEEAVAAFSTKILDICLESIIAGGINSKLFEKKLYKLDC